MLSLQATLVRLSLRGVKTLWNMRTPIEDQRRNLEKLSAQIAHFVKMPADVTITPVKIENVPGEWIHPTGIENPYLFLYLHGGGFSMGSLNSHRLGVAEITRISGIRGLALDYRLAPENPFPAAVEDAVAVYCWLLANGFKPENIIFVGDSAGAGLVLSAMLLLRDLNDPLPAGGVLISPWVDLVGTADSIKTRAKADPWLTPDALLFGSYYAAELNKAEPLISPLYADLHGLPPLLIQTGNDDVLLNDSTRLAAKAWADELHVTLEIWGGMWHDFPLFASVVPEAQQAQRNMSKFIWHQCLKAQPPY